MTNVLWKNTAGGNWGTASDWNDDVVPNDASDQVYLPTLTSAYTVTADGDYTVNYLEVDAKATLSITGGQINIDNNALGDSGTVNVGKGATLALTGNFIGVYGSGALVVDGALSVDTTSFAALFNSKITLAGGSLLGSTATVNYTENYEATISGYGVIGDGWSVSTGGSNNSDSVGLSLSNANGATINANGSTGKALTLDTGANWIENGGVIESTGAGGLVIESSVWQDGTLTASGTAGITVEGSVQNGSVQLGGLGTTAYNDPAEGMIGILFTQRMMESPQPPKVFTDFWTLAYGAME